MTPVPSEPGFLAEPPNHLRGLVHIDVHWSGVDLRGRNLVRAQFLGARLRGSILEASQAHGAILRDVDLTECKARSLAAREIDLEGACLRAADLRQSTLVNAVLLDADLEGAKLNGADLRSADLRGANLRGADLRGADLRGADLRGARIEGANFDDCLVSLTRLHGIDWHEPTLREELLALGAYDGLHPHLIRTATGSRQILSWTGLGVSLSSRQMESWVLKSIEGSVDSVKKSSERFNVARMEGRKRRKKIRDAAKQAREERREQLRLLKEGEKLASQSHQKQRIAEHRAKAAVKAARKLRDTTPELRLHPPAISRSEAPRFGDRMESMLATAHARREEVRTREARELDSVRERLDALGELRNRDIRTAIRSRKQARARARAIELELEEQRRSNLAEQEAAAERDSANQRDSEARSAPVTMVLETPISIRAPEALPVESEAELRTETPAPEAPTEPVFDPEQRAAALQALDAGKIPGGPGADLRGLDMRGRKLAGASWNESDLRACRLDGARLQSAQMMDADLRGSSFDGARLNDSRFDRAILVGVRFDGSRMRDAVLRDALLAEASLVDVDLRGADLRGADLRQANLTGADLRRARLEGCDLRQANLTATRMSDLDLNRVNLDRSTLDQADLAGVRWVGASIIDTDLSGALGLSGRDRERLADLGALAGDRGLEELLGRFASRQVRFGIATLALGLGTYLGVHYLAGGDLDTAAMEAQAEEQRMTDPLGASSIYEELANASLNLDDQVSYRIEAAALAVVGGNLDRAQSQYRIALDAASLDPRLAADVRLHIAAFYLDRGQPNDAINVLQDSLSADGIAAEVRARTIMLIRRSRVANGLDADGDSGVAEMFESLGNSPEALADLGMELAELLASEGDTEAALAQIRTIREMDLPQDQALRVMEARARILDRSGRMAEAATAWEELIEEATTGSLNHQAARLALADLRHRQGDYEAAFDLVDPLLEGEGDGRIQGRAWLVRGRLLETAERYTEAATAYESALGIEGIEVETVEEARISLARTLLATGQTDAATATAAALAGDSGSAIMVQARLGQARQLIDSGDARGALALYDQILDGDVPEEDLMRAAQAGKAEALVQLGDLDPAIRLWRLLLTSDLPPDERAWIEVQLGHGLLQGGQTSEATSAFRSLSLAEDTSIRYQGILGLAEVALASGERERARALYQQVVDRAPDPSWQVQALQELALMATEDGQHQEALAVWRTLLGRVPPGHPAAAEARISVALALAESGQFAEAIPICGQAMASAAPGRTYIEAGLACGEIHERAGESEEAIAIYDRLNAGNAVPGDLLTDIAAGKTRVLMAIGRSQEAIDTLDDALSRLDSATHRLPLVSIQAHLLQQIGDRDRVDEVIAERDRMADEAPEVAGPILMDAAMRARNQGRLEEASALLERAVTMTMTRAQHVGALIELGDIRLEQGETLDANFRYEQALAMTNDSALRFGAGMGLAELRRRSGDTRGAIESLEALAPPDQASRRWWTEARARAWSELGEDEQALAAWQELTELTTGDPSAAVVGLRGQADVLMSIDRPEEALELYVEARSMAIEPGDAGWTELGQIEALIALDRQPEAEGLLRLLRNHDDVEVATQAAIRHGQLAMEEEEWSEALSRLDNIEARHLGPGWDASIVESRVQALIAMNRINEAISEWETLADRWPDEEEALLPSWLGRAHLARDQGSPSQALRLAQQARSRATDPGYRAQAEELIASLE